MSALSSWHALRQQTATPLSHLLDQHALATPVALRTVGAHLLVVFVQVHEFALHRRKEARQVNADCAANESGAQTCFTRQHAVVSTPGHQCVLHDQTRCCGRCQPMALARNARGSLCRADGGCENNDGLMQCSRGCDTKQSRAVARAQPQDERSRLTAVRQGSWSNVKVCSTEHRVAVRPDANEGELKVDCQPVTKAACCCGHTIGAWTEPSRPASQTRRE